MATVLIIGASRGIGLETVKCALEAGHIVRALARSARRIPVDHPNLTKRVRWRASMRSSRCLVSLVGT
jgi:NAD(P)-dependent dehydrogenase (short-subunit alcohol dehydrogenase family)